MQNCVLVTDEKGGIEAIIPAVEAGEDIEKFKGILTPGFVNCHCHLELSHLKDVIPPFTGLIEFLVSVVQKRGFAEEIIQAAIQAAEKEMYENGIVAVGDICNTADAIPVKSKSSIYWHSFIEVLSFSDAKAEENFSHYKNVLAEHDHNLKGNCANVITPHAPYSICPKTFELINTETASQVISIHNQEHPAEDELYKTGQGDYLKLFKVFGLDHSPFPVTGKSSVQSWLPYFTKGQTILLVHNTYMTEEDIIFANDYARNWGLKLIYCLCVNANRYIENKFPTIDLFIKHGCHLVLGTDSYSSNWHLNIAKEMEAVLNSGYFNNTSRETALETILKWATINGASALEIDDKFGSFEKGKQPGIVLLQEDLSVRRLL